MRPVWGCAPRGGNREGQRRDGVCVCRLGGGSIQNVRRAVPGDQVALERTWEARCQAPAQGAALRCARVILRVRCLASASRLSQEQESLP